VDEDWPDDQDWPGDVVWPADDDNAIPWAGEPDVPAGPGEDPAVAPVPLPPGHFRIPPAPSDWPPRRDGWRFGPAATMVAVVVVAGAAGAGVTMALTRTPAQTPAAASSPATTPGGQAGGDAPGGQAGGEAPGGSGGTETSVISMLGTVTAVSSTSITIGGNGLSVTAAVTSATKFTGQVSGIGQIKVGDHVWAQMTQSGSKVTAIAIQYPAQQQEPAGPP
jgi:hypothetical protein